MIYERNTALSESLYGVTQATEIALRNALHRVLSAGYGTMWFDLVTLEVPQSDKIASAKEEIRRNRRILTPGAIVAELGLGFWTALIAGRYEKHLWVPHLHKAFPHAALSRSDIFEKLEKLRTLRNRIAHHEPIVKLDLPRLYSEAVEALRWVCPTSADWVRSTNSFNERFHEKPLSYAPPKFPSPQEKPTPGFPAHKA